jgi:hypothetical protein
MRLLPTLTILFPTLTLFGQVPATFDWKGAIQPQQTLEVRNINGDIKAETAPGPDVEISVRIVGTRPDPSTIRIDVVQHEGGILLCTIYQGLTRPEHCSPTEWTSLSLNNSDIRVTYTVKLPSDVNFVPKTVNGSITADLPGSPISAATVNGRIVLSTGKPSDAHVVNGSILATLGSVEWAGSREFGAVNGAIDIELPDSAHASVRANTIAGSLANDFGLTVQRTIVGSRFSGDINGGGSSLALGTVVGSIHLRRTPAQ